MRSIFVLVLLLNSMVASRMQAAPASPLAPSATSSTFSLKDFKAPRKSLLYRCRLALQYWVADKLPRPKPALPGIFQMQPLNTPPLSFAKQVERVAYLRPDNDYDGQFLSLLEPRRLAKAARLLKRATDLGHYFSQLIPEYLLDQGVEAQTRALMNEYLILLEQLRKLPRPFKWGGPETLDIQKMSLKRSLWIAESHLQSGVIDEATMFQFLNDLNIRMQMMEGYTSYGFFKDENLIVGQELYLVVRSDAFSPIFAGSFQGFTQKGELVFRQSGEENVERLYSPTHFHVAQTLYFLHHPEALRDWYLNAQVEALPLVPPLPR